MNSYEHTFIAKQDLTESQSKSLVDKYTNIIKENSGKIVKIEEWGLKNFSNNIHNYKKGFYFHIKVKKHDLETNFFEKKDI